MKSETKLGHSYVPNEKYGTSVAYFSMEFGIDQALKIYSGGLGYLAGSHLRAAYQLKQKLIGIGILWKFGYYDQERDEQGYMQIRFQRKYYTYLKDTGITVPVFIKGYQVLVRALYLDPEIFGTVPLYLLTTDIPENDQLSRSITTRLYHPNDATRVAQSIVLGIGGAKVVEALGGVDIHHLNEAHGLPLAFHLYNKYNDIEEVRKRLVFTTHTPEKAGNTERPIELLTDMGFFGDVPESKVREITHTHGHVLQYTPAALYMAKASNGVSKLHGVVSRDMWKDFHGTCEIKSITNSQDEKYWMDHKLKQGLETDDDDLILRRKRQLKVRLFNIVADQTGKLFDENILTIVWARRFAGYKRAELIMRDIERFLRIVNNEKTPIQIIWAGKPYPEDYNGVSQFNHIRKYTYKKPNVAILTGYELSLSAALKKGSDIWLNTPRRPQEASGTSGMTAAMNGSISLSTLDGWMPEFAKSGHNSFIIPPADLTKPLSEQDDHDHEAMMQILEDEIIPCYYHDKAKWLDIMKNAMRDVRPYFDSKRMANEYYELLYNAEVAVETTAY